MEIVVDGKLHGLKWSAAHIIPNHPKCGRLHGHDYVLSVRIDIEDNDSIKNTLSQQGYILDFGDIKDIAKEVIKEMDHHFLLPIKHNLININGEDYAEYYGIVLQKNHIFELNVPIVSSENLAKYFENIMMRRIGLLISELRAHDKLGWFNYSVHVAVFEGEGQGAWM